MLRLAVLLNNGAPEPVRVIRERNQEVVYALKVYKGWLEIWVRDKDTIPPLQVSHFRLRALRHNFRRRRIKGQGMLTL